MKGLIEIRTYHNYFGQEYHSVSVKKDSPAQQAARKSLIFLHKEFGNEIYGDRGDELRWEKFIDILHTEHYFAKLHTKEGGEK